MKAKEQSITAPAQKAADQEVAEAWQSRPLPKLPIKPILLWHTLRRLRAEQWRFRVKHVVDQTLQRRLPALVRRGLCRRVPAKIGLRPAPDNIGWFKKRCKSEYGFFSVEELLKNRFTFLHQSKDFGARVQWRNPEMPRLWDLNLHYFEYLAPLAASGDATAPDVIERLIQQWIQDNPCPAQPGWHPYPLSLRSINWIKLFIHHPEFGTEAPLRNLYAQLLFLERRLERHLGVNHLLENARALVFGGLFFAGEDATRWLRQGLRLLRREVHEQILPGGGHIERSPMYHALLLEGLLDTFVYLRASGEATGWLEGPVHKMARWIEEVRTPDGWFPLFNDCALGVSACVEDLVENAQRMIGYSRLEDRASVRDCDHYFVLEGPRVFCAIDGAPIGPGYNPGHAHSDNLNFELFLDGRRVVADAGVYTYENGPVRAALRATAAHNTVLINEVEQSECWSAFRVGRRSSPLWARTGRQGACLYFQGKYENGVARQQRITHERLILLHEAEWLLVWDTIEALGAIEATSFCRFAGACEVRPMPHGLTVHPSHSNPFQVVPLQVMETHVHADAFSPAFGKALPAQQVAFRSLGQQRLEMGYLIFFGAATPDQPIRVVREGVKLHLLRGTQLLVSFEEPEPG